jgi:GDP-mannose 6-dehydrogenase
MKISIFGMGYVGCVSGACFADMGHEIIGVDPNPVKVELINSGKSPIVEHGLDDLIAKVVGNGSFRATADSSAAIQQTEMALICVGTPSRANGSIDLRYVERVCEQIGTALSRRSDRFIVVIRSTVLPGTMERVVIPILEKASGKKVGRDFGLCMHPEFLREGTSIHDFYHPPKTVIGEYDGESGDLLHSLYAKIPGAVVRTQLKVAEMVKYADNCFHAVKVTFANEIGNICKEIGVDSHKVMDIFCQDAKLNLSPYYLKPGFAFGGSCLPKDLRAITHEARTMDLELPMLNAVIESNNRQINKVIAKLSGYKGRTLGFLGLSFKGGTDDMRSSPIVEVIESMLGKGFEIRIFDQHVSVARLMGANKEYIEREIPHLARLLQDSVKSLMESSDIIVVSHNSPEFMGELKNLRPDQELIDLVRVSESGSFKSGNYYGICW